MERVEELLLQRESKVKELEVVAADKAKWKRVLPGYRLMLLFGSVGIVSSIVLLQKSPEVHGVAMSALAFSGVAAVMGIVGIENEPYDRFNSRAQLDLIDLKLEAIALAKHHLELTQVQAEAAVGRVGSSELRELCRAFSDPGLKVFIPHGGTEIKAKNLPIKDIGKPDFKLHSNEISYLDVSKLTNLDCITYNPDSVMNLKMDTSELMDLDTPHGTEDSSDA